MRTTVKLTLGLLLGSALTMTACSDRKQGAAPADPWATAGGFCDEWAKNACNAEVARKCGATDEAACAARQAAHCMSLLSPNYAPDNAVDCLTKVKDAYADAELTVEEYEVVTKLAAPCDKLIQGPGQEGDICTQTSDCNTLNDLVCVSRGLEPGTCQIPSIQGGGLACTELYQVCQPEFFCDGRNCLIRKGDGESCDDVELCAEGLNCTVPEGAGTCVPKAADNAPCESDDDCASRICARSAAAGVCAPAIFLNPADPLCQQLR